MCIRIFLGLVLLALAPAALAWGPSGHVIVTEIAAGELTPRAAAEVERLLGERAAPALRAAANWADELRANQDFGLTAPLHYVNLPRGGCRYRGARDCFRGRCVVGATERYARELGDSGAAARRGDALRWVIHLVADVHQPLHAGYADDRGGNDVQVRYEGEGTNLHALLDSGLLRSRGLRAVPHARQLLATLPAPDPALTRWDAGAPTRWAEESCAIVPSMYPESSRIDRAYQQRVTAVLETRLVLAGHRLAALLNAVLDPAPQER